MDGYTTVLVGKIQIHVAELPSHHLHINVVLDLSFYGAGDTTTGLTSV